MPIGALDAIARSRTLSESAVACQISLNEAVPCFLQAPPGIAEYLLCVKTHLFFQIIWNMAFGGICAQSILDAQPKSLKAKQKLIMDLLPSSELLGIG